GATDVGLAGLVGKRFRLALGPLEAEPPGNRDGVDEDRPVAVELARIAEPCDDGIEMRLAVWLVVAQRRVGATDEHREIAALIPGLGTDGVAGPTLDGEIARFQVHEQRGGRVERPQQRGLADARLAEDAALDAARRCQTLIGRDDGKRAGHCALPFSSSFTLSAPVLTVRAGSKVW